MFICPTSSSWQQFFFCRTETLEYTPPRFQNLTEDPFLLADNLWKSHFESGKMNVHVVASWLDMIRFRGRAEMGNVGKLVRRAGADLFYIFNKSSLNYHLKTWSCSESHPAFKSDLQFNNDWKVWKTNFWPWPFCRRNHKQLHDHNGSTMVPLECPPAMYWM